MIIFKNADYPVFLSESCGKRLILFGAGGTLQDFLSNNAEKVELLECVDYVLDNNPQKTGQAVYLPVKTISIQSVESFARTCRSLAGYVVLLLLADPYVIDAVEQLDKFPLFDRVWCYYGMPSLVWGRECCPPLPVNPALPTSSGRYSIPRRLHSIWFGKGPGNDLAKRRMSDWQEYCLGYELFFWNEDNYDLSGTPLYVRQAYEAGKYAFVSDYARLDVVYKYGGFYFDADVEMVRSIESLVPYQAVFGYTSFNRIGTGIGFGGVAGCGWIKRQLEIYHRVQFQYGDGTWNRTDYINNLSDSMRRANVNVNNTLALYDDVLFLPSSFFSPFLLVGCGNGYEMPFLLHLAASTTAIPSYDCSWQDSEVTNLFQRRKQDFTRINTRLLDDWKRSGHGGKAE